MIDVIYQKGKRFAIASYLETDEEEKYWQGLIRETKYMHSMCERVGLWILAEFQLNKRMVVVTSINTEVNLSEQDLEWMRTELLKKLNLYPEKIMPRKLMMRVELGKEARMSLTLVQITSMKKMMATFAIRVQEKLGLPNHNTFLLWNGRVEKDEHYEKYYLFITVRLYRRQPRWIPEEIKNVAIEGKEMRQVYISDGSCETRLILYDDLIQGVVEQLR